MNICQIEGILRYGHMVMMGHVSNAMRSLRHSFFEALMPLVIIRTSPSSSTLHKLDKILKAYFRRIVPLFQEISYFFAGKVRFGEEQQPMRKSLRVQQVTS